MLLIINRQLCSRANGASDNGTGTTDPADDEPTDEHRSVTQPSDRRRLYSARIS